MRCQPLENLLEICVGWSHVAGYSVSPYFIKDHVTSLSDFEPEAESILVERELFQKQLQQLLKIFTTATKARRLGEEG